MQKNLMIDWKILLVRQSFWRCGWDRTLHECDSIWFYCSIIRCHKTLRDWCRKWSQVSHLFQLKGSQGKVCVERTGHGRVCTSRYIHLFRHRAIVKTSWLQFAVNTKTNQLKPTQYLHSISIISLYVLWRSLSSRIASNAFQRYSNPFYKLDRCKLWCVFIFMLSFLWDHWLSNELWHILSLSINCQIGTSQKSSNSRQSTIL